MRDSSGFQEVGEFLAGGDPELRVCLVEVVLDGAGAEEQLGGYLAAAGSFCREPDDLTFLWREPFEYVGCGRDVRRFAGRSQFGARAVEPWGRA